MHKISDIGKEMLGFQERLAIQFKYKPIAASLFEGDVRGKYLETLPPWCVLDGETVDLVTTEGTVIARGYERIVIGDYGAFVEFAPQYAVRENMKVKESEIYRIKDEKYSKNVKYIWLTAKDKSDCKIYFQKKTVDYADYRIGMLYVSPYEVFPK